MQKVPVAEAAKILGISKEAVYNRIRRGSLESTQKDGVKFVILDSKSDKSNEKDSQKPKSTKKSQINQNDSEFVKFLLNELSELKEQNANLQHDKERLFKEKEQMLLESKNEISTIYKERDEKLMAFLNAMSKIPQLNVHQGSINSTYNDVVEAQVDDEEEYKFISINEYLNDLDLNEKARKKAEKKIIKNINKSKFIKFKNGVILIKKDKKLKQIIGEI